MVLGGLRRFSSITATLLLTGGLVWGCTHEKNIVLPSPGGSTNSVKITPTNTTPVNVTPSTNNENSTPVNTTPVNTAPVNSTPVNSTPSDDDLYLENGNQDIATEGGNEATEDESEVVVDVEAQARDVERVARVTQIQEALNAYKSSFNAFPETLDSLREGFLSDIPKDVDGDDFSYTPIGALPAQFYDLCYELEVGTTAISAGYHCASPEGIAHP